MNQNKTTLLDDTETREETIEEAKKFFSRPDYVHYIGLANPPRPGVRICFTELEHAYFPPKTDKNKDFIMRLLKWEELVWVIVSIPKTEAELMIKVAAKHNLRPVNGTPHMFSKNETKSFPIEDTDNTFVLENIVSPDSIINLKEITGILTREEIAMEEIFEETKKRIEQDKKNKKSG